MEIEENKNFVTNPNFKLKKTIIEMKCCFGLNDIFDVYNASNDNNELYLISPGKKGENSSILITRIKDNKLIKELEGFKGQIHFLKHFYNKNDKINYLVTSYKGSTVRLWNLLNYNLIYSLNINYSENTRIYSCLSYFPRNKDSYLITSSNEDKDADYTKIYDFYTSNFIGNLQLTNTKDIFYLLLWNKNNNDYVIGTSNSLIFINNIETRQIHKILESHEILSNFNSACLIKKDDVDYLYVSTVRGCIIVWDLDKFIIKENISYKSSYFCNIIQWSEKYILVAEKNNGCILVIDIQSNKVISVMNNIHDFFAMCLKKIKHPIYGECLLSSAIDNKINLSIHP